MDEPVNPKLQVAQRAAKLFVTQMAGVPPDVQLMTIEILAVAIFVSGFKKEKRLSLLSRWMKSVRENVTLHTKGKTDGQETVN